MQECLPNSTVFDTLSAQMSVSERIERIIAERNGGVQAQINGESLTELEKETLARCVTLYMILV